MDLQQLATRRFMRQLFATPRGRAFVFNQIADAEDGGEAEVFDHILAIVEDPKLRKIIDRHRADEVRHGALFRGLRDRTGVDPGAVPEEVKVLHRLNKKLGGFFDRPLEGMEGVVEAYLILQVIEERAVAQFELHQEILESFDREAAAIFREVAADEARHLRYCRAVAKEYGADPAATEARLAELRRIEADVFRENSRANVEAAIARGLIPGPIWGWIWSTVSQLSEKLRIRPLTSFATA